MVEFQQNPVYPLFKFDKMKNPSHDFMLNDDFMIDDDNLTTTSCPTMTSELQKSKEAAHQILQKKTVGSPRNQESCL